jgi:hypothetical protein
MTHKALLRQLQISCLGLDHVDPLRLLVDDVIEALREHAMREVQRLGQEIEQEPVAWLSTDSIGERHLCFDKPLDNDPVQPLYTTPPQQEPVAYWKEHAQGLQRDYDSLLADFQAQRTWVGLTDEEENEYNYLGPDMHWVIQEIAAKLKEKNHG